MDFEPPTEGRAMFAQRITHECLGRGLPSLALMSMMVVGVFGYLALGIGIQGWLNLPDFFTAPFAVGSMIMGLMTPSLLSALVASWRSRTVALGPDGIAIEERFISFHDIESLVRVPHRSHALTLKTGAKVFLAPDSPSSHPMGQPAPPDLHGNVQSALEAFHKERDTRDDPVARTLEPLSRDARDELLDQSTGYRDVTFTEDQLVATLRDPVTAPDLRIYLAKRLRAALSTDEIEGIRLRSANNELLDAFGRSPIKVRVETEAPEAESVEVAEEVAAEEATERTLES